MVRQATVVLVALACVTDEPIGKQPVPADFRTGQLVDVRFAIINDGGPTDFVRTYNLKPHEQVTVVTGARCRGAWFDDTQAAGVLRRVKAQPSADNPNDHTAVVYEAVTKGSARVRLHAAFGSDPCENGQPSARSCRLVGTVVLDVR